MDLKKMPDIASVWGNIWDNDGKQPWEGGPRSRRVAAGEIIGARVYELPPRATGGLYHFHHGHEELIVVLKGTVTLRTPDGECDLTEGSVVLFPRGAQGAHQTINKTDHPTRHLITGNIATPDAVEYPDSGQISVMAKTISQTGEPLFHFSKIDPEK
ncbi:MAG: cupin domain-containing protein [Hyphomicrobiaceae bacterium]